MYGLRCIDFHETQNVQQHYVQTSYTEFQPYWKTREEIYDLK